MNFVMKFGVKEFPEIIYTEDKFEPIDSYSRYYENEIQNEIKKQIGGSKKQLRLSYRLQYIANLDGIMSRMATSEDSAVDIKGSYTTESSAQSK